MIQITLLLPNSPLKSLELYMARIAEIQRTLMELFPQLRLARYELIGQEWVTYEEDILHFSKLNPDAHIGVKVNDDFWIYYKGEII